jgi:hypothetical protein
MFDDDRLMPAFLENQIGLLESHPQVILVGCNAAFMDMDGNRTGTLVNPPGTRQQVEFFTSSLEVARLYAKGLAIPIYGAVSRTPRLMFPIPWKFRRLYGDVYYLLHLPRYGTIAYQDKVLYEYRLHSGQESALIAPRHQIQILHVMRDISRREPALSDVFLARQLNFLSEETQRLKKACRDCLSSCRGLLRALYSAMSLMLSAPRVSLLYARRKLASWMGRHRK